MKARTDPAGMTLPKDSVLVVECTCGFSRTFDTPGRARAAADVHALEHQQRKVEAPR